ncbi:low-density lipoprotein receptor-related protein 11 [Colossoma macropomum]|uniref:low-density lipoprotein receptor-related protein 11 n=1 Tax=Colossoma macropomum TaxID=42526 RepID=UPI0018651DDA|nr:low-density lipoprotein receptor-related protein 11 [Colossoma macropomum]
MREKTVARLLALLPLLPLLLCFVLSSFPVSSRAARSSSPLSDLKNKISGVEELLEEFRQQLQHEEQPYARAGQQEEEEEEDEERGDEEQQAGGGACLGHFDAAESRIIRAAASIERGATFLSAPSGARGPADCLRACCAEPRCTVAVVVHEERAALRDGPRCYLFNCTYRGASVCAFSPQRGFTAYSHNGTAAAALRRPAEEEEEEDAGGEAWMRELDEPPRGDAGQDVMVQLPTDWAILDGRDSIDDHGIMRYEWALVKGDSSVNMKVTHPGLLKLSGLREGVYTFQMTVTDTIGQRSSDNVSVTVLAPEHHAEVCTRHCSRYQFMCDDGCCIDISYACDGKQQCPDRSDEDFCRNFDGGRKAVTHTSSAPSQIGEARESEGRAMIPAEPRNTETPVQSKQQQPSVSQGPCMEPPMVGPCRGVFPRWYYDPAAGECKHFLYGGCKGNRNNFLQQVDCVAECIQKPAPVDQQATAAPPPTTQTNTATKSPSSEAKPQNSALVPQNPQPVAKVHTVLGGQPPPESGAILPLVLGVIISALLLLMVACRLRLVRHRMKKARPLTTEESDYLINGMYL